VVGRQERIRQATSRLTAWMIVLGLGLAALFFVSKWLVLPPLAVGLIVLHNFAEERRDACARISGLESTIASKTERSAAIHRHLAGGKQRRPGLPPSFPTVHLPTG
jgi:hypothetical protein